MIWNLEPGRLGKQSYNSSLGVGFPAWLKGDWMKACTGRGLGGGGYHRFYRAYEYGSSFCVDALILSGDLIADVSMYGNNDTYRLLRGSICQGTYFL